jgi:ABC-type xylose transport system permease subunit
MNVIQRMQAPTPKFFKTLRAVGLALAAASGALLAAPVALPAAIVTIAGYLTVAGTVATAVAQTAVAKDGDDESEYDDDSP